MTGGSHGSGRRPRADEAADAGLGGAAAEVTLEEFLLGASLDELREFLAADYAPIDADPAFKERLRRELWELVRKR